MSIASNPINFDHPEISSPEQTHDVKRMSHKEAMILKLTHPPTNVPELEGLPTNDARTQVVINHRNVDVLKEPNVIRQDASIGIVPWQRTSDYGLIIPTGARIQYIGAVYADDAPTSFVQDIANTKIQDNFNFDNWQNTVNLYRPIYKSTSLYANVTAFNNQGIIACQQFNPNIMFSGKILEMSWNAPDLFRKYVVKLVTMDPTIAVSGDHDLDFNPAPIDAAMKELSLRGKTVRLDPNTSIQLINMREVGYEQDKFSLVPTPSQIMTNSLRAYGGKFQEGCFAVNRLNTVSPAWLSGSNSNRESNGLYQCWYLQSTGGSTGLGPFQEFTSDGKATIMLDTLWSKDMTWCCMRIQGLSPNVNPNIDPSGSRVSPIAIKNYYGMECQPVWGGPWQGLSRVSPDPDLGALQTLMDTFYKMPDGMEVKYNFLGTLLPKLATFIPAGMSILKSLFSSNKEKPSETRHPTATGGVSEIAMLMRELLRERSHKQVPHEPKQRQPTAASSKPAPKKKKPKRKPMPLVGNKAARRQRR